MAQTQPTQVCQQLTPQQITAQIENIHWQEKQSEQQVAWSQKQQEHSLVVQNQQYMVDHLAIPGACVLAVIIICFTVFVIYMRQIAADVRKNNDDNLSEQEIARIEVNKPRERES